MPLPLLISFKPPISQIIKATPLVSPSGLLSPLLESRPHSNRRPDLTQTDYIIK